VFNYDGGQIGGSAIVDFGLSGAIAGQTGLAFQIWNFGGGESGAGTIGGDASISVSAGSMSAPAAGVVGAILNQNEGQIIGAALMDFALSGDLIAGDAIFTIDNIGGTIGQNARIALSAANVTLTSDLNLIIDNSTNNATIGGDAAISLSATDVQANSFLALIDSGNGAFIGSNATIMLNIAGTLTTTGDATVNIALTPPTLGQPKAGQRPATVAAIDFLGGTYEVGGTLLSTITGGDGGITVNTASMHADIIKIGAFGDNGSLTIGGGRLSGSTELKLYAPGSNGQVNFISNVTLDSESSVIIAANAVTINNGVVVTITGDDGVDASVFTNVPNYSEEFGGNGSTTGTFDGNGATTAPLDQAPPFDDVASGTTADHSKTSKGNAGSIPSATPPHAPRHIPIARVGDSNELLNLANKVTSATSQAGDGTSTRAGDWMGRDRLNNSAASARILSTRRDLAPNESAFDRNAGRPQLQVP
jgi:hypothetical protein